MEEEKQRKVWDTAGYPYAYQRAEKTAVQTHTQAVMEVDTLASAAGNGGVKRKREEEDFGVKDSSSKRTTNVEGLAYLPPVPAPPLRLEVLRLNLNPLSPTSSDRPLFIVVLMLVVHQGRCDHDGYSVARRCNSRGSKQTLDGCECPNEDQIATLKSLLVWYHPRGAAEKVVTGIVTTVKFYSRVSNQNRE
jgi:hypothetical protein